jgi:glycosyltransferase involved in cell wall biosynthesis
VQYIPDALRLIPKGVVEVRLVGPSMLSPQGLQHLRDGMEIVGAVPRADIECHYEWADALVLPTLSEGSANVVVEAMARGLPVVTTPNAGSVIEDGLNGLLVHIRDSQALASALLRLANDEALRRRLGSAAAKSLPGFGDYAACLSRAVGDGR